MLVGKRRMGQRGLRERASLYFSTSFSFSHFTWCVFFCLFIIFYVYIGFFLFFKGYAISIIQFPVEIRNRGWQGDLIAATRDETFWEGWMGGHPG